MQFSNWNEKFDFTMLQFSVKAGENHKTFSKKSKIERQALSGAPTSPAHSN